MIGARLRTDADMAGHQRSWRIDGTCIHAHRMRGHWTLDGRNKISADWLQANQLAGQFWPTRAQTLRSYQAAAALNPPPAWDPATVTLTRVAAGHHRHRQYDITRRADGRWQVTDPDHPFPVIVCATLARAAQQLHTHILTKLIEPWNHV